MAERNRGRAIVDVSVEDDERHVHDVGNYIHRNRDALNASIKRSRSEIAKGRHAKKSMSEIISEGKTRHRHVPTA